MVTTTGRRTQADRRARSRNALLEAAARGLSKYGYGLLSLSDVAAEAGYTRGALYHQFAGKEDLALEVVRWVARTWTAEVGHILTDDADPVATLLRVARAHAVFCRREIASVLLTLRVEFTGQDHPIRQLIDAALERTTADVARLVTLGRERGTIPAGPPAGDLAAAYLVALEAVVIELAGRAPYDVELAERAVCGLLGIQPESPPAS